MTRTFMSSALAAGFALAAGQAGAQAITPAQMQTITDGTPANVLFISGATAPQQTLIDTIQVNLCSNTFTRLRSTAGNSARYQAWGCTRGGQQVVVYYSTLGSNWGVQPVLFGNAGRATPRLNPASCAPATGAAAGAQIDTCTVNAIAPAIPDVGVSDVAPSAFVGPNVPTFAQVVAEFPEANIAPYNQPGGVFQALTVPFRGSATTDAVQGVVFGIAISNPLTLALQAAQSLPPAANVRDNRAPNLPKRLVSSILEGTKFGPDELDALLGVDTSGFAGPTRYVVCRRVPTSGTWTWTNLYWLRNGLFTGANATVPAANTPNWNGQGVAYVNNVTGGNVRACMNRAAASGLYAFGTISAENDNNAGAAPGGTANTWSFAKLDGVPMENTTTGAQADNLVNAKNGTYDYVGEVTLNRRGPLAGVKNGLYTSLVDNLRGPAVCVIGAGVATGALQIAGATAGAENCVTNWSREGDPFSTPKQLTQ